MKQVLFSMMLLSLLPSCTAVKEQIAQEFEGIKTRVSEDMDQKRIGYVRYYLNNENTVTVY